MAFIIACGMLAATVAGAFIGYFIGGHAPDAALFGALIGGTCVIPLLFMGAVVVMLTVSTIEDRKSK